MKIGFIGIGVMGEPMAINLLRAGTPLVVWNRSPEKCESLRAIGAIVAATPSELFAQASVVFVMLYDGTAIDAVLRPGSPQFAAIVKGHTIVNTSSTSPAYSRELASHIAAAGGRYIEAPVSGSRVPAEGGQLVAMLAGDEATVEEIRPLFRPMCRETVFCGPVGNALLMKLSVNLFMLVMVAGLAEAVHFADKHGLNLNKLQAVLDAGPMSSVVSRTKLAKMISRDFSVQAAISDGWNSSRLIAEAARDANISCHLLDYCETLLAQAAQQGHAREDLAGILHAVEARTVARAGDMLPKTAATAETG